MARAISPAEVRARVVDVLVGIAERTYTPTPERIEAARALLYYTEPEGSASAIGYPIYDHVVDDDAPF